MQEIDLYVCIAKKMLTILNEAFAAICQSLDYIQTMQEKDLGQATTQLKEDQSNFERALYALQHHTQADPIKLQQALRRSQRAKADPSRKDMVHDEIWKSYVQIAFDKRKQFLANIDQNLSIGHHEDRIQLQMAISESQAESQDTDSELTLQEAFHQRELTISSAKIQTVRSHQQAWEKLDEYDKENARKRHGSQGTRKENTGGLTQPNHQEPKNR